MESARDVTHNCRNIDMKCMKCTNLTCPYFAGDRADLSPALPPSSHFHIWNTLVCDPKTS